MARKKRQEEHENHERWLVSYADFITLLFAFFVVMYSISSVNEGKYRVLSESMIAAFHSPAKTLRPIQIGTSQKSPRRLAPNLRKRSIAVDMPNMPMRVSGRQADGDGKGKDGKQSGGAGKRKEKLDRIQKAIEKALEPYAEKDMIKVRRTPFWLEVQIQTEILFDSGSARLRPKARHVLSQVADVLRPFPNPIEVEGFTDNVPIDTVAYPSNWELSAARAASVVHLFTDENVDPRRLAAVGFGEHHPVADNSTPQGRAQNRRIVLVVLGDHRMRQNIDVGRTRHADADPTEQAPAANDDRQQRVRQRASRHDRRFVQPDPRAFRVIGSPVGLPVQQLQPIRLPGPRGARNKEPS